MRICFVTPGYGKNVVGGAESLARSYAERLAASGHRITVLTTSVTNPPQWSLKQRMGTSTINGVEVQRFPVTTAIDGRRIGSLTRSLEAGLALSPELQQEWLLGTDYSTPLFGAIERIADTVDAIVFLPYLFASSVIGALIRPDRSIVIPCLHDEPYVHLGPHQRMLRSVRGLVFNTEIERRVAQRIVGDLPRNHVVGIGFDIPMHVNTTAVRRRYRLASTFACYGGRKEREKGLPLLVEGIRAVNLSRDKQLPLVVFGRGPWKPVGSDRRLVRDLGNLSASARTKVMAGALVTATMSTRESFSHLIMESWCCGVPVLVNARCDVTRQHCEDSGGGIWVRSPDEFADSLRHIELDASLRHRLGEAGREYVRTRYNWPLVMERLTAALADLAGA